LGFFENPGRRNNLVDDKKQGAVTYQYVEEIKIPVDKDIFRFGYIKKERIEKVKDQSHDMEDGNEPDNADDFFCPLLVFEYRIIDKNPDIKKGQKLKNIKDAGYNIEKHINEMAGQPFNEKIKHIADHGNKRADQDMKKNRALESIGVVFPQIIRIDENNNQEGTQQEIQ
jgi:hypothetical protein